MEIDKRLFKCGLQKRNIHEKSTDEDTDGVH